MSDRRIGKRYSRKTELRLRISIFFSIIIILFLTFYNMKIHELTEEQKQLLVKIENAVLLDKAEQTNQLDLDKKKNNKLKKILEEKHDTVMIYQGRSVTNEDIRSMCRIVEAEATGLNEKSKLMVANVVLNRFLNEQFPDTIKDVVFESDGNVTQFSPISDGRYYKVRVTKQSKRAVARALSGEDKSKGALYFMARKHSSPENVKWFDDNLKYLFKYQEHEFFK